MGKAWHLMKGKAFRNPPSLVPPGTLDFDLLPSQVPRVLDGRLHALNVGGRARVERQLNPSPGQQVLETDFRLTEQLRRRNASPALGPDERGLECGDVAHESLPPRLEALPSVVGHDPGLPAARGQTQVRVVDAEQQAMFGEIGRASCRE